MEDLKSVIVYSCETSRKYHYHDSCLRAALLTEDGEKAFRVALGIVAAIRRHNEDATRRKKMAADALEYLDSIGDT